jgi:hypothetical protein
MCPRKGSVHNRSRREGNKKAVIGPEPGAQWVRTLPIGNHGIMAPTLWARLGDAPGRWESFRHLQAQAGAVLVTKRSGKQRVIHFRFACDKS